MLLSTLIRRRKMLPNRRRPRSMALHFARLRLEQLEDRSVPSLALLTDPTLNLDPDHFTVVSNKLFFVANDGATRDLWVSDGTATGTHPIHATPGFTDVRSLTPVGNLLVFVATTTTDPNPVYNPTYLFRSDGTDAGTYPISTSGYAGYVIAFTTSRIYLNADLPLPVTNGKALYIAASNPSPTSNEQLLLQETDGTSSNIVVPYLHGFDFVGGPIGNKVIFRALDDTFLDPNENPLWQLYTSDGTPSGTQRVPNTSPAVAKNSPDGIGVGAAGFIPLGNTQSVFASSDGIHGYQVWTTDGTSAPVMLTDLDEQNVGFTNGNPPSFASVQTAAGRRVFFVADDPTSSGPEVWVTDGTGGGTHLVKDVNTIDGFPPTQLTAFGQKLFFVERGPNGVVQPWITDGNASNTVSLGPNIGFYQFTTSAAVLGSNLYFTAGGSFNSYIYSSDGTAQGTQIVADPNGQGNSNPLDLTAFTGGLYFNAYTVPGAGNMRGLWKFVPAPKADAGGPYSVAEGGSLTLDASSSSSPAGLPLTYAWTINGQANAASGVNPTLSWSQLQALGIDDGPGPFGVSVQVDDGQGNVVTSSATTLTLNPTPPTPTITGAPAAVGLHLPVALGSSVTDPSQGDTAAGFSYAWTVTLNGNTVATGTQATLTFTPAIAGTYGVSLTATNEDGDSGTTSTRIVAVAPPTVQSVLINDGSAQRSMVTSLTVTFSGVVNLASGALEVDLQGGSARGIVVNASVVGGRTVAVITFTGSGVTAGSLPDGRYRLVVHSSLVTDSLGQRLDGNGDTVAGDDYTQDFFRLFGDVDGNGVVDVRDLAVFRTAYNTRSGQAGYLWYLDFNGDGRIDLTDYSSFLARYGQHI